MKNEIEDRFTSHKMTSDQIVRSNNLKEAFKKLAVRALDDMSPGRELSIVLTHLEEASFMAVAGIARSKK